MKPVIQRVIDWNALRYDQVYDKALQYELLSEEIEELNDAPTFIDRIDALCDIYFVAIGAMWKLGINPEEYLANENTFKINQFVIKSGRDASLTVDIVELKSELAEMQEASSVHYLAFCLSRIIRYVIVIMYKLGLTMEQIEKSILIVCDSNDTKTVKKTPSHIKANVDKGVGFIPPESALKELLGE